MAAQKVFTIGSAKWNGVAIPGIKTMGFNFGGDPSLFFADGDLYSQFAWLENVAPKATIETVDLSLASGAAYAPGTQYALLQWFAQRATGIGGKLTGSTALKATWNSSTMIGAMSVKAQQAGESSYPLSFTGISTDGTTAPITISLTAVGS